MIERLKGLYKDEEGATMVEYALMVALIAVVCILAVTGLGSKTKATFGVADNAMTGTAPAN